MSFTIELKKCSDDPRTLGKTFTDTLTIDATLRDATDIHNPSILIEKSLADVKAYNMVTITEFGRTYFMAPPIADVTGLTRIDLSEDYLTTYAAYLFAKKATITRSQSAVNGYLLDDQYKAYGYKNIVTKAFPNAMDTDSIILMTVG